MVLEQIQIENPTRFQNRYLRGNNARSARYLIVLAIALGATLRVAIYLAVEPIDLVGDEHYYVQVAENISGGPGHVDSIGSRAFRPPLHAFLLSLAAEPGHPDAQLQKFVAIELVLGTLLIGLTAWLGWTLFGMGHGVLAAYLCALYPTLIAFSHYLWSENLFACLITTGITLAIRIRDSRHLGTTLACGATFGLAALTRELAIPVVVVCGAWLVITTDVSKRRQAACQAAMIIAVASAIVAPWSVRNFKILNRFVPVGSVGWFAIAEGNTYAGQRWLVTGLDQLEPFRREYFGIPNEAARLDFARRRSLNLIADKQPWWLPQKVVRSLAGFLSPDSFVFKKASRGAYGHVAGISFRGVIVLTTTSFVLLAVAATAGLATTHHDRFAELFVAVALAVFSVHVIANVSTRFRVPWIPIFAVFASHALIGWKRASSNDHRKALIAVLFTCAAIFWASWQFAPDMAHLWVAGTYVEPGRP